MGIMDSMPNDVQLCWEISVHHHVVFIHAGVYCQDINIRCKCPHACKVCRSKSGFVQNYGQVNVIQGEKRSNQGHVVQNRECIPRHQDAATTTEGRVVVRLKHLNWNIVLTGN